MPRARQGADRTRLGKPRQAGVRRDAGVEVRAAPRSANMMAWGRIGIRGCIVGDSCSDSPAAGAHACSCWCLRRRRRGDRLRAQRRSILPLEQGSIKSLLNRELGRHRVSSSAAKKYKCPFFKAASCACLACLRGQTLRQGSGSLRVGSTARAKRANVV